MLYIHVIAHQEALPPPPPSTNLVTGFFTIHFLSMYFSRFDTLYMPPCGQNSSELDLYHVPCLMLHVLRYSCSHVTFLYVVRADSVIFMEERSFSW